MPSSDKPRFQTVADKIREAFDKRPGFAQAAQPERVSKEELAAMPVSGVTH